MFKLHPLFISLIAAQGLMLPAVQAATLKPFSPYLNDNRAGVFCVCNGSTQTLSGNQQFAAGLSSAQSFTLGYLQSIGSTDYLLVGKPRLDPGLPDYTITLPDTDGSGSNTFDVYFSANMRALPTVGLDTEVPNYVDVKGGQYINTRVAQVSKGTINVDIGQEGALTTASTNGWSMAAKQSQLFVATGSGNMNWNSDNRINFTAVLPPYGGPYLTIPVDSVATYKGEFSVTTLDNLTTNFNVTGLSELQNYNDWLIEQLTRGKLSPDSYTSSLDKAVSLTSGDILYSIVARDPSDEAAQPIGELVVLSANGANATATVNGTLEVANASSAVQASNGGTAIINGKLSSTGTGTPDSNALSLLSGSKGVNNGVINGGFLNEANGTGVDYSTLGHSNNTVMLQGDSQFTNNGVINNAGSGTALAIYEGSAINNGNINVGGFSWYNVNGVFVNGEGASFVNTADGLIWLGRTPQNSLADETTETWLNGTVGINVGGEGSAINDGHIVLGVQSQGIAMQVQNGPNARLQNNGTIDIDGSAGFQPEENIGISAIDSGSGGRVGNAGTLNLIGNNAIGIKVVASSGNSASAYSTGTINVNGGSASEPDYGAVVDGAQAVLNQNGTINLNGENAIGALARNGGRINIGESSPVSFNNINQTAWWATGSGSTLVSNGAGADVATAGSTLYRLDDGASFSQQDASTITLSGDNTTGFNINNGFYYFSTNDRFLVNGNGATAVRSTYGSTTIYNSINLQGNNSTGVVATSGDYLYSTANISGSGANATGFDVDGGIFDNNGQIVLDGANSTAVRLHDGASLFNRGWISVASGYGIDVSNGASQYFPENGALRASGKGAAVRVSGSGSFTAYGEGIFRTSIEGNEGADAVLLDEGATSLTLNDLYLDVSGGGSGINNLAEIGDITLNNIMIYARDSGSSGIRTATPFTGGSNINLNVSGGATGYTFANADGSTIGNDLLLRNVTILAGSGSTGIRANTTGRVISEGNIYITTEDGGSAIVTSTASQVVNRGDIYSYSTVSPVIDLRGGSTVFINEGTLGAESPDILLVAGGATSDRIALIDGSVTGDVNTGEGTDTVALTGGTLDGSVTMGSGVDNQAYVENVSLANVTHITTAGGEGSTLALSKISASGGSFASDDLSRGVNLGAGWSTINFLNTDWTLTDNLKLAHSTINIDGTSTLYAGNGINPVLAGATDDSLTVNNYGTLDLTNGAGSPTDTLTIDGSLASFGGSLRLNSDLNGGGALAAQRSDTLRVTGDANGTTFIEVLPSATSTGALSDSNLNSVIEANEGISLAQVAGSASADSFVLKGGYLAAGPWSYGLYSFAPGSSDAAQRQVTGAGNAFWDYRLANNLVCENGAACQAGSESRAAVVPQVPSYISAPVGLAYYTAAILGDLQQRLGELRHQQGGAARQGGEMFLRYSGSNLRYQTSQNFKDFGYNVDLDYSALQVGGNVLRLDGDGQSLRGGVAYTRGNTRLRPDAADGYSSTTFDSDSLALYGTWLRDDGLYLDGTLSYNWHRGETDIARQRDVAKIRGKGWTASLQSGYPFELGSGVRLEPQAQVIYLHLGLDNFTDKENLTVKYDDYNQTVGRVGAKLDRSWSDNDGRQYTPYVQANYFKGWGGKAKTTVGAEGVENLDHTFSSGKFGQMWEVGVGGTVTLRNDVSLYAQADYRKEIDSNGAKGWGYTAGVRWTF